MRKLTSLTMLLLASLLLAACLRPVQQRASSATVSGNVTTAPGVALPAGAVVVVQLRDASDNTPHGGFISQQQIAANGNQPPIAFEIAYNTPAINAGSTYVVFAMVQDGGGQLIMSSPDGGVPVITNGNPTKGVAVPVTLLPPGAAAAAPTANSSTAGDSQAGESAATAGLSGPSWSAFLMNNGGADLTSITGVQITAQFGADGQLSGFGGCNNYSAAYTADQGKIQIGPIASTMKTCSEPANVMQQESEYLAALQSAVTYQIQGQLLTMQNASGQTAVQFNQTGQ